MLLLLLLFVCGICGVLLVFKIVCNDWLRDVIKIFWRCYLLKDLRILACIRCRIELWRNCIKHEAQTQIKSLHSNCSKAHTHTQQPRYMQRTIKKWKKYEIYRKAVFFLQYIQIVLACCCRCYCIIVVFYSFWYWWCGTAWVTACFCHVVCLTSWHNAQSHNITSQCSSDCWCIFFSLLFGLHCNFYKCVSEFWRISYDLSGETKRDNERRRQREREAERRRQRAQERNNCVLLISINISSLFGSRIR